VGIHPPFRAARQLVGFSAVPLALSLVALVPVITIGFGEDWFRSGGADEGTGEVLVIGIGLVFAMWCVALVALGLRTAFRLPWLGVVGALALAAVIVAALFVLPEVP
jgi:hypothetical protein